MNNIKCKSFNFLKEEREGAGRSKKEQGRARSGEEGWSGEERVEAGRSGEERRGAEIHLEGQTGTWRRGEEREGVGRSREKRGEARRS